MLSLTTNAEYRRKKREENLEKMKEKKIRKDQEKYLKLKRENDLAIIKMKNKAIKNNEKHKDTSSPKIKSDTKSIVKHKVPVRKKKKTKTHSQLVKELDAIFSRYIRLRDADDKGICVCITCGSKVHRKEIQNGHFISRGNYKYRRSVVNCFGQCMPCNIYKSGNYISYTLYMI
jgi:Bacteriophage Lambda NinG protein